MLGRQITSVVAGYNHMAAVSGMEERERKGEDGRGGEEGKMEELKEDEI